MQRTTKVAAAVTVAALMAAAAVGATSSVRADTTSPSAVLGLGWASMAPGFCAAPADAPIPLRGGASAAAEHVRYAPCGAVEAWRGGAPTRFEVYGSVSIESDRHFDEGFGAAPEPTDTALRPVAVDGAVAVETDRGQTADPDAVAYAGLTLAEARALPRDDANRHIQTALDALGLGERVAFGVTVRSGAVFTATVRRRVDGRLEATMTAIARIDGVLLRRTLTMPYRGVDTLRYQLAALSAGVAADRIALRAEARLAVAR